MKPGATLRLTIEKPAAGGRMIARQDGAVVLVAGAIPGEAVEARVERVQRGTIWASTTRVIAASPDRVPPRTDWACGGAVFSHIAYERQLALKSAIIADAFARIGKMPLPARVEVTPSPRAGYRVRARLHVRHGRVGFFREGTHDWCDPGPTGQLLPDTLATLRRVEEAWHGWPDLVTDLVVAENVRGTERLLHLELPPEANPTRLPRLPVIEGATGISAAAVDGARIAQLAGVDTLADQLTVDACSGRYAFRLTRHAQSFFQANRFLLQPLVDAVMTALPAGPVLDLYAGVGLFSVAAAARGDQVIAVEGDRHAAGDLSANALSYGDRLRAHHQSVEAFLGRGEAQQVATVILDPPRTGVSADAMAGISRLGASHLVYVSCDVATLARDGRRLVDAGYRLDRIGAFDLFPETAHVESLAVFVRERRLA
jgi:23S rRNA (uracil1939-C5)-methyltransferase